jgi:hypothetical protein
LTGWLGIFYYTHSLEYGIAKIKNEKSQHERNGITPVDEHIGDEDAGINK